MPPIVTRAAVAGFLAAALPATAGAEPRFLSKQYTRCSSCHFSPTGGGLLTPYGRSLSHRELSTFFEPAPPGGAAEPSPRGEEAFLWGALGDRLEPVHLGIELRPSHLELAVAGFESDRNILMTADLIGAFRRDEWTVYGQVGRQPAVPGASAKFDSYEYWVARQPERGWGFRVGRYLPAYGIRFADHTAYNRSLLGFEQYDQIFGVEVSQAADRYLLQVSLSPGLAEAIIDDDGRRAFTASGRLQIDLTPRTALVASGIFRDGSRVEARSGSGGVALGFAPISRLTLWNQLDARFREHAPDGTTYVFVNETAFEAFRGVWLKLSPQFRSDGGITTPGLTRWVVGADFLPRTHWNVNLAYYRDRDRRNDIVSKTVLLQLHLYI
jgi:hypothetical protein